jgi:hypothetical protein
MLPGYVTISILDQPTDIVVVMPLVQVWEVLSSNLNWDAGYPEIFCGSLQSLQENIRIAPQLGNDHYLQNPFQFISHPIT